MKYFKDIKADLVYGYDETDPTQVPYIDQAIENKWEDITGSWPLSPTRDEIISSYNYEAQKHLDDVAKFWGYDSLFSAASYASSTNAKYKADAASLIAWRDSVWSEAYTIEQGDLPNTAEEFLAMLPAAPTQPTV